MRKTKNFKKGAFLNFMKKFISDSGGNGVRSGNGASGGNGAGHLSSATSRVVIAALLLAMEVILTRFCSISTPIVRIGFGFLPIAMLAILLGPWWAAATYALGDFIGAVLIPTGQYFPGFTLTAFLSGLLFGLILHKKTVTYRRALLASCLVVLLCDLLLNTYWLTILMGDAFWVLLPTRIIKAALMIPVETLLIPLTWNRVLSKIKL